MLASYSEGASAPAEGVKRERERERDPFTKCSSTVVGFFPDVGCIPPSPQPNHRSEREGGRGAFRERAEEDYSDSFWLADFAFSNRSVPISVLPVIRYAGDSRGDGNLEE